MKYKPTPLNIASAVVICFSFYLAIQDAITPGSGGFGYLALLLIVPCGITGFAADYALQKFSEKYIVTFLIESALLGFLVLYFSSHQGKKTLVISDHLEQPYILTIYGMDGAPEIPRGLFDWNPHIKVPDNGILLTSTSIDNELHDTRWVTASGIDLQSSDETAGYVAAVKKGSVACSEKKFDYRIWMLTNKRWTSPPRTREIDSLVLMLKNYLCKN